MKDEQLSTAVQALAAIAGPASAELRDSTDTLRDACHRVADMDSDTPVSAPPVVAACVLLGLTDSTLARAIDTTPAVMRAYRQGRFALSAADSLLLCLVGAEWAAQLEPQVRARGDGPAVVMALHISTARLLLAEQARRNELAAASTDYVGVMDRWEELRPMLPALIEQGEAALH